MEWINFIGLILIAITNALIAVQVKKSQVTVANYVSSEVDYDSLARAMEASWPTVNIDNQLFIDYDKLAEAINKLPAPTVVVQTLPTVIPSASPNTNPSPYWQSPVISGGQINTYEDGHYTINVNGADIPVRKFPAKRIDANGRGDSE